MKTMPLWAFLATCLMFASPLQANDLWTKIPVPLGQYSVQIGHLHKQISPSCAFDQPYAFYMKPGEIDKLVIFFNGGGACWNYDTCSVTPGVRPIYATSTDSGNNPNNMGGLIDANNPNNPYKDWTMVFLPYCTGDIFLGSKDTRYQNPRNPADPTDSVSVHHRGHDNFLYVMNYLRQQRLGHAKSRHSRSKALFAEKILVTGSSAGSYGATLNFPWLKKMLIGERSKVSVIGDGGIGVISEGFMQSTFYGPDAAWYIDKNLHPLFDALQNEHAANFMPEAYSLLATRYPYIKFAQYTTAYDVVQKRFWDVMLISDGLPPYSYFDWNDEMTRIVGGLEAAFPNNYRTYIDPGCDHTIFSFDEFYSSNREGISFLDWITAMTGEKHADKTDWRNLGCAPGVDCGEESLAPAGIQACLERVYKPR